MVTMVYMLEMVKICEIKRNGTLNKAKGVGYGVGRTGKQEDDGKSRRGEKGTRRQEFKESLL